LIRPWGCVQSHCCGLSARTRDKIKNKFSEIPLINSSLENSPPQNISHIQGLQDRLNTLEIFLKEYVVDVNYLERLNNRNDDKDLPSSNQSTLNQNERISPSIPNNDNQLPVHNLQPSSNTHYFYSQPSNIPHSFANHPSFSSTSNQQPRPSQF